MKVHPTDKQQNGTISVRLSATFVGDTTDATDQQLILAFGDPQVELAGLFVDPLDATFSFAFPTPSLQAGITTDLQNHTASFMTSLPMAPVTTPVNPYFICNPQPPAPVQGPLDCVVSDPVRAATLWTATIQSRVQNLMTTLRTKTPIGRLPDATV